MIFSILMGLYVIVSGYIIINLYRKLSIHEQWKESLQTRLVRVLNEMRSIDNRGLFENDDYTGTIFKDLTYTLNEVASYTDEPYELIKSNLVELPHGS